MRILYMGSAYGKGSANLLRVMLEQPDVDGADVHFHNHGRDFKRTIQDMDQVGVITGEHDLRRISISEDEARHIIAEASEKYNLPSLAALSLADRRIGSDGIIGIYYRERPRVPESMLVRMLAARIAHFERLLDPDRVQGLFCLDIRFLSSIVAYHIANSRGIPFARFGHSRIHDRFTVTTGLQDRSLQFEQDCTRNQLDSNYLEQARKYIEKYRRTGRAFHPSVAKTVVTRGILQAKGKWPEIIKKYLRRPLLLVYNPDYYVTPALRVAWLNLTGSLAARRDRRKLSRAEPDDRPFILYPMQCLPEVSMNVWAQDHVDALQSIAAVARRIPANHALVVREHPRMFGMRPKGFYRRIRQIPGVILVGQKDTTRDLLERCVGVVTATGTTGLEAMYLGKPVRLLARPFYAAAHPEAVRPIVLEPGIPASEYDEFFPPPITKGEMERFVAAVLQFGFSSKVGDFYQQGASRVVDWFKTSLQQ